MQQLSHKVSLSFTKLKYKTNRFQQQPSRRDISTHTMITKPKKKSQILRFNRKLSSQTCKRGESMPREKTYLQ
jgi:hypothetical protein